MTLPRRVSPAEAHALVRELGYVYLDVRTAEEFGLGHPEGAYNVPLSIPTPQGWTRNVDFVAAHLGPPRPNAVLDLACGTGRHTEALRGRGFRALGVDLSLTLLARRPGLPRVGGDMRRLPFAGGSFDWVLNFFTSFGYFESERENFRVLQEVVRVLAPGGTRQDSEAQAGHCCTPTTMEAEASHAQPPYPLETRIVITTRCPRSNRPAESGSHAPGPGRRAPGRNPRRTSR